jgi:NAD(P)-dependent dehydrogenase (short-subunit alcohol dehydrogenase family)
MLVRPARFSISLADSHTFANLSGDFNPLHIDTTTARRLLFGSAVPHGIHILLSVLEGALGESDRTLQFRSLRVIFSGAAKHDNQFTVEHTLEAGDLLRFTVFQHDRPIQTVTANVTKAAVTHGSSIPDVPIIRMTPRNLTFEDVADHTGTLNLTVDRKLLSSSFPSLAKLFPASQLATLLATTRIVGMECPGLRSIFAELNIAFEPSMDSSTILQFRTVRADRRLSLVRVGFEAPGATGEVTALFRPDPVAQSSAASISRQVQSREFVGQQALVIGGSRGLGEVTAKLLAMGGADVAITFARGHGDAIRVAHDILENRGRCHFFAFDVTDPPPSLSGDPPPPTFRPTHVYFFATPAIQLAKGRQFDDALFRLFCDFYVGGLVRAMSAIDRLFPPDGAPLTLLYPSTTFLDEASSGAAEYSAAKAAGEVVCRMTARTRFGWRAICPRLPPLRTDQTANLHGRNGAGDPVPVLLAILREIR